MKVILDIEANGLDPDKIWCIVVKDIETNEVFIWDEVVTSSDDGSSGSRLLSDFKAFTETVETFIGHNLIGYDVPVLSNLLNIQIPLDRVVDTLVVSRLLDSQRPKHSLEWWGEYLGYPKVEHDEWDKYSPEMLHRCVEDVHLNHRVYTELLKEAKAKGTPKAVFRSEHRVAEIVDQQRRNGFLFDEQKAQLLLSTLQERKKELDDVLLKTFVSLPNFKREVTPKVKKDGTLSSVGLKGFRPSHISGYPFSLVDWPDPNLNSQQFLIRHLQNEGWRPTIFTDKGNPRLTEWVLEEAAKHYPKAKLVNEWDLVDRRITMLQSWIEAIGEDGRIHGSVNTIGAKTHRMSHWGPNVAQVPATDKPYGAQCRSLFKVRQGYRLLGTDASGIQLRVLANYVGAKDYINEVVDGDIHLVNLDALGIGRGTWDDDHGWSNRPVAKTFIYAWLLGAGAAKVGEILGCTMKEGGNAKYKFLQNMPALKKAKYKYEKLAERGYIIGLDGRWIPIQDSYFTLSVLLQSGESIIMKKAAELWTERASHLEWKLVAWVHDEWQTEVLAEHAEELGQIQVQAIKDAGPLLGFKCPLDGEYKVGDNWCQTH